MAKGIGNIVLLVLIIAVLAYMLGVVSQTDLLPSLTHAARAAMGLP